MKLFHSSGLEGGNIPKLPHREIPAAPAERCLAPGRNKRCQEPYIDTVEPMR